MVLTMVAFILSLLQRRRQESHKQLYQIGTAAGLQYWFVLSSFVKHRQLPPVTNYTREME